MLKTPSQIIGTLLIVGGVLLLGFAGYTYFVNATNQLPAHITPAALGPTPATLPGFSASPVPTTALPTPTPIRPSASPTLTASAEHATPTLPPIPTLTPTPYNLPLGMGSKPARLIIPKLSLDAPVKEAGWATIERNRQLVSEWQIPYDAAGHHINSANPGERGNSVYSGHHNQTAPDKFGKGLFAYFWDLVPGDSIFIADARGRKFLYQVTDSYKVKEAGVGQAERLKNAEAMNPTLDARATFVTCWAEGNPFSNNTYRWIVIARLVGLASN